MLIFCRWKLDNNLLNALNLTLRYCNRILKLYWWNLCWLHYYDKIFMLLSLTIFQIIVFCKRSISFNHFLHNFHLCLGTQNAGFIIWITILSGDARCIEAFIKQDIHTIQRKIQATRLQIQRREQASLHPLLLSFST